VACVKYTHSTSWPVSSTHIARRGLCQVHTQRVVACVKYTHSESWPVSSTHIARRGLCQVHTQRVVACVKYTHSASWPVSYVGQSKLLRRDVRGYVMVGAIQRAVICAYILSQEPIIAPCHPSIHCARKKLPCHAIGSTSTLWDRYCFSLSSGFLLYYNQIISHIAKYTMMLVQIIRHATSLLVVAGSAHGAGVKCYVVAYECTLGYTQIVESCMGNILTTWRPSSDTLVYFQVQKVFVDSM
jgi:hypothetical protein